MAPHRREGETMPRLVYLTGWALLVRCAFLLADALVPPTPGVTLRNARLIRPGMTPAEVEALLGAEPDARSYGFHSMNWGYCHWTGVWLGARGRVWVSFGKDNRVGSTEWSGSFP